MFNSLFYTIAINGKDLPHNILIPFAIIAIIYLVNRIHRPYTGLTGIDILVVVILIQSFAPELLLFPESVVQILISLLLTYFSYRLGLKSKHIFTKINDVNLLKFSLFDMFMSIIFIYIFLFSISYLFFPILFEKANALFVLFILSLALSLGSKSLFKNYSQKQTDIQSLFKVPFALIDIHQLFIFVICGVFILFFDEKTSFHGLNQSRSILVSLSFAMLISILFGFIMNLLEKKREINLALIGFSMILSGILTYYHFSLMFIPFFIGSMNALFINDEDKYSYLSDDSKSIVSNFLLFLILIDINFTQSMNFYVITISILIIRFAIKFINQKLSIFYLNTENIAIPGAHMLFMGLGKTGVIIILYFFNTFDHIYENEIKIIVVIAMLFFELLGLFRSKPEHIISNKSMIKEIDS